MHRNLIRAALFLPLLLPLPGHAQEQKTPGVVVSIKPLHSLVQGVMGATGKAQLLLKGAASPHGFALKPSQLRTLHQARVLFYVDPSLENFLPKILATLPPKIRRKALLHSPGVVLLKRRPSGLWEESNLHPHNAADAVHQHEQEGQWDTHLWLDPHNAAAMITSIAQELAAAYPPNRPIYQTNAQALKARIKALDARLKHELAAVQKKPFLVLHDAYQYFSHHYHLQGIGSILLHPDHPPSARRILEIRTRLRDGDALCVFREPQSPAKLIHTITANSNAKTATLDALGSTLKPGADLYFQLLKNLAYSFKNCTTKK